MPVELRPQHFRTSFDQIADDYEAARPGYPDALVDAIVAGAELPPQARILEIGCGTGQATMPFARRGYQIVCLDIGAALLAIARRKFAPYPNVELQEAAFESWPVPEQRFDLVMSATAFHWITPEIGYPKAAHALKATGSLAIFANEHPPAPPSFAEEMYRIERRIVPEWPDPRRAPELDVAIAATAAAIDASQCFRPVRVTTYPWSQRYTTAEYLRLINTYSNYRQLDASSRDRLFGAIAELIDQRFSGTLTKQYAAVLYLAQKRSAG